MPSSAFNCPTPPRCSGPTQACRKIEEILKNTPGVQVYTTVIGFSLLSTVQNTYSGFFFVTLKPWDERTKPEEQYTAIKDHLNRELGKLPEGDRVRVLAAGDPGRRHLRRRHVHPPGPFRRRHLLSSTRT